MIEDWLFHLKSIELGHVKKVIKDKEGKPKTTIDYLDSNLHDSGVKRMLELGYEMYRVSTWFTFSNLKESSFFFKN